MKYKKKPVIIDAEPYRKGLEDGYMCPAPDMYACFGKGICANCHIAKPFINTLEGEHYISPTDMIITGVKGERYPCKKDIFEKTYEIVGD